MIDTLPDRLCNDPKSPFFNQELLERGVGIRFNGVERTNVEEYCVSEGWVRVVAGKSVDRRGNPMTVKLKGTVEPFLRTEKGKQHPSWPPLRRPPIWRASARQSDSQPLAGASAMGGRVRPGHDEHYASRRLCREVGELADQVFDAIQP